MIVAESTSKWGGKCCSCGGRVLRDAPIYKVPTVGETTKHGQGPGKWVGSCCRAIFEEIPVDERTLFDA